MEPDPTILLYDRVEFKLYSALYHLERIKQLKEDHAGINVDMKSVHLEIEIDGFLSQLYGSMDALFVLINDKLNLDLSLEQVNGGNVKSKLNSISRADLISDWEIARKPENWLGELSEFRHQTVHREKLRRMREYDPYKDQSIEYISKKQKEISFSPSDYMPKEFVKYFEESLQNVKSLVYKIRMKDQALQLKK